MRRQLGRDFAEGHVGHKLVEDKLLSDQATRELGLIPGNAECPRQRLQNTAEQALQRQLLDTHPGTPGLEHAVDHRDQRDKSQQHGANSPHHLQTIHGTRGGGVNKVDVLFTGQPLALRRFGRGVRLGLHQLGHQEASRRRHKARRKQVLQWHT